MRILISDKFTTLAPRAFSAVLGAVIIIFGLAYSKWSYFILFLAISISTLWEFYRLVRIQRYAPLWFPGLLIGASLFVVTFLIEGGFISSDHYFMLIPLMSLVFLIKLYKKGEIQPFVNTALFYLGVVYIAVPFALGNMLAFSDGHYSYEVIMGLLILIWANDIGAYFVGSLFGKARLFERISPKKSWEGSIGGAVFSMIAAIIIIPYFKSLATVEWGVITIIVIVAGTYGDLVESHFKRSMQVKDSGSFIMGHGGFLDRFDSWLLTVPFVVVFLKLF